MKTVFAVALAVLAAGAPHAQGEARRGPEPGSAFPSYQPYREPQLANWRQANEEVKPGEKPGAHSAKPAAAPQGASRTPDAERKSQAGGHAGHH